MFTGRQGVFHLNTFLVCAALINRRDHDPNSLPSARLLIQPSNKYSTKPQVALAWYTGICAISARFTFGNIHLCLIRRNPMQLSARNKATSMNRNDGAEGVEKET